MGKILLVFSVLILLFIAVLSCNEPSGPLELSNPTESILTVTLEDESSPLRNAGNRSSALPVELSISGELALERNGKSGYQALSVWTQCPDDNFVWYAIYRSQTPGIASNTGAADTSVIFSSVSDRYFLDRYRYQ